MREHKTIITNFNVRSESDLNDSAPVLVTIAGPLFGSVYLIETDHYKIGRNQDCELCLVDDAISRNHALIFRNETGDYLIKDLESTNGTYVNYNKIVEKVLLENDKISIGQSIFKFLYRNSLEADFHDEIYKLASIDGLTQIYNRKHFEALTEKELSKSRRNNIPLAFVMIDIDFFKKVNDVYGHQAGDYVLREIAQLVQKNIRKEDIFGRFGGEEFSLCLSGPNAEKLHSVCEKLRKFVKNHLFIYDNKHLKVTISLGAVVCQEKDTLKSLIERSDKNLYQAKEQGRDCSVISE